MSRIVRNAMGDSRDMAERGAVAAPSEDTIKITLYRNGFTINDGPFRDAEEPESKKFLATLSDGYIPQEVRILLLYITTDTCNRTILHVSISCRMLLEMESVISR